MLLERREYHCLHCLGTNCVDIRFDKMGRPYSVCLLCAARTFVRTKEALTGIAVLGEMIPNLVKRVKTEPAFAAKLSQTRDEFVAQLAAKSAPPARESSDHQVPAQPAKEQVA